MNGYFDDRETRGAEEREAALMAALPRQIGHAQQQTTGFAKLLAGVDPDAVTSRAALAALPVTRKSDLIEAQKTAPPFGGLAAAAPERVFASPVGAADRIYVVDRGGTSIVVKRDATFQVLARNHLDDSFSASPAIAGDELFLRGDHHLYCIAE